jgi:predicted transcriptional regulator
MNNKQSRGEAMPRHLDDLRCKQDQFIQTLYSVTEGDTRTCGDVRTITRKLGFDRHTCVSIVSYFLSKGIIEQRYKSLSHLVKLTSKGVDFVEVTFSAVTHVFETKLSDCTDGAACVFEGLNSPALTKSRRKTA